MAWYSPPKYEKNIIDVNEELSLLKGELSDSEAKITLAKFLYRNIGFTAELLTGIKLYSDQIITIKGMLRRNYSLCVWGRGVSKSFTAAIYCILQCIFEPNTTILIAGPTFRTARFIFTHIEKICDSPQAKMLAACFGAKIKRSDEFRWSINGGEIIAIPLNGEKIRGFRANVLVIDEFLLMSEEMVEKVLIPYLVAPQNIGQRQRIREREDRLIKKGLMKEEERYVFPNQAKMIALSSASYTCEYLYRKYDEYIKMIYSPDETNEKTTYFVSQLAWDAVPMDRIDKSVIELAQSNEANSANFKREYGAEFIDGSDGYFSMNKMLACSVPEGESPTLLLKGEKNKKYLLAIDPNFSNSDTADFFAMCVIELDEPNKEGKFGATVVHTYAKAGKDLKDHIAYFHYLLTYFNIEMIIIDNAGCQFIDSANESELFRNSNLNLKMFNFSAEKDGDEYKEQLKNAKREYNKQIQKIVFTQVFNTDSIRKMNEWLQGCIDYKKIWFGAPIKSNEEAFDKAISVPINDYLIDIKLENDESPMTYFIDNQDTLIKQMRYQCASIEVKTTSRGVQTFDLPMIQKRDRSASRARKDQYTSILLVTWLLKQYTEIIGMKEEMIDVTFEPFFI